MEFDEYVVVRLVRPKTRAPMTEEQEGATQDAHLASIHALHERGLLLAAGPATGPDEAVRGWALMSCDLAAAVEAWGRDPGVLAGRFVAQCEGWRVPAGMIVAGPGRPPRSMADVADDGSAPQT